MTSRFKHIISILLVVFLLLPTTIKLFDGLFHHHSHFHCTAKNEKHFHIKHETCPILNFQLSIFSPQKKIPTTQRLNYIIGESKTYSVSDYYSSLKHLFLLRAPPIYTNERKTSLMM